MSFEFCNRHAYIDKSRQWLVFWKPWNNWNWSSGIETEIKAKSTRIIVHYSLIYCINIAYLSFFIYFYKLNNDCLSYLCLSHSSFSEEMMKLIYMKRCFCCYLASTAERCSSLPSNHTTQPRNRNSLLKAIIFYVVAVWNLYLTCSRYI